MKFTNTISEDYVASGVINSPEKVIPTLRGEGVNADYFHNYLPKLVWRVANNLFDDEKFNEIEMLEFSDQIKGVDDGDELMHEISKIRRHWCGHEAMKPHIKTLREMYATRFAHKSLTESLEALEGGELPENISDASQGLREGIMAILTNQSSYKNAEQSTEEFADLLRAIHKDKSTSGIPSGIPLIDNVTGGLGKNELWIVGAPTSCGKTVLMLQVMASFLRQDKNVLMYSLETEANMIHARLVANLETIDMGRILGKTNNPLIKSDLIKMRDYMEEMKKRDNLIICDEDSQNLDSIQAKAQQINEVTPVDLIVVDYIQLVNVSNTRDKARHEQVAEVTRTMKQMAKKFQCPILTATQLNDDGRVRESRAISHDADVLLLIGEEGQGIHVAKNRSGERGHTLDLNLNGGYQRFS